MERICKENARGFTEILDTSVVYDRKEGIITVLTAIEYPPCAGREFEIIFPEPDDYALAIDIASELRTKGKPIGAVDTLIAAMCVNRDAELLANDKHFLAVKEICKEFKIRIEDSA